MTVPARSNLLAQAHTRRRFLAGLGLAAGAGLLGPAAISRASSLAAGSSYDPVDPAADTGLILVSIQLGGGMDALGTVVPSGPGYSALRPGPGPEADLHRIDSDFSLNSMPYLAAQFEAGRLAVVHGVGDPKASLSHFDATDMWEKGSLDFGTTSGWLGRSLSRLVNDPDPLLGVSVGPLSPTMRAPGWSPYAFSDPYDLPWTGDFNEDAAGLAAALSADPSPVAGTDLASRVRASQALVRDVGTRLCPVIDRYESHGDDEDDLEAIGMDLGLVAEFINAGLPTRAFHVGMDGFDTHSGQDYDLPYLLRSLDTGIGRFYDALGPNAGRVVVMTWTEFGRRPEWNGQGTEHGTAGTQFVVGPRVAGGHHGTPSPLDRFDDDGNFLVTTDFRDYLGGVIQGTLGVEAAAILEPVPSPLELVR